MAHEERSRSLRLPLRVGAVLVASLLVVPAVFGSLAAVSSGRARGGLAALAFIVFFGGIVLALVAVRGRAEEQRRHDRQWGPRPRPPG